MQKQGELLAALKELVSIVRIHTNATGNNFAWAEMDEAKAVIASVKGGACSHVIDGHLHWEYGSFIIPFPPTTKEKHD